MPLGGPKQIDSENRASMAFVFSQRVHMCEKLPQGDRKNEINLHLARF